MLKPQRVVFGVLLLLLFAGPVSQVLSDVSAIDRSAQTGGRLTASGGEAFAQSVDTAWVRRYDGPGNVDDWANAIIVDDSGYVYVTGRFYISGTDYDYGTIKYYPNGDTAWVRRYDGLGNSLDGAMDMAVDGSGYVYVTGQSFGSGTDYDYATIKYKPNGDTAWVRRYDGPENTGDNAMAIAVYGSGNVCVTGFGVCWSEHPFDYVTIKYYPDGDTAWVRGYNGPGDGTDKAVAIAIDDSGNAYVTGYSTGSGTSEDYATIKYYPSGDTAWVRRYNGPANGSDYAEAIAVDDSGFVYVTGYGDSTGTYQDYATIKYDSSGNEIWVRRYDGPANGADIATAIALDASNNVYVTGYSDSTGSSQDYATIKYDSSGNELWVKRFNCANGTDKPYAIAVDGSNDVYVTGRSGCGGVTEHDYVTIKYYSNGDTAWLRKYHGPVEDGYDYAYGLAVDTSGNVYVTGASKGSGTDYDYCTIKYVQTPSGVKDETGGRDRPSEFELSQNYPNPFNPTTKIEFTLAKSGFVTLEIHDVLGRKVRTLVSEELSSGYKSVVWDGKNEEGKGVASGVYFYQLKVGDFSEPKKMLLLK
ncbi:MAG: SBBP repeat-containing protein [Candidatus Zixiibacteriota bacterium]